MKMYDVVIIGAGIAGLAAAYQAKKDGLSYIVLEAQERIGGRISSYTTDNKLVIELGAEWIGNTHAPLLSLCSELNIALEIHQFNDPRFILKSGKEMSSFSDLLNKLDTIVKKTDPLRIREALSLYTFLKPSFTKEEMRRINIVLSPDFAQHIRYVSAKTAIMDMQSGGEHNHMDFHVVNGNSSIINTLAKTVSSKLIVCNSKVTKVDTTQEGVIVHTATGTTYTSKKLIIASSAQSFKSIEFSPRIPKHKKLARNLKYGDITKLFVTFNSPLALENQNFSAYTDGPLQYIYVCSQHQSQKKFALCIYSTGKRAQKLSVMDKAEIWEALLAVLPQDIFATKTMWPDQVICKHWGQDAFTQGAYAVFQPFEKTKNWELFLGPTDKIYFAGEHLSEMTGYMSGALQSGIDAIKKIGI